MPMAIFFYRLSKTPLEFYFKGHLLKIHFIYSLIISTFPLHSYLHNLQQFHL